MTTTTTDPLQTLLQRHLLDWQTQLQTWALSGALLHAASQALNLSEVSGTLTDINRRLSEGNWSDLPKIELLSGSGMGGAIGAWAESTLTIYLNSDWLLTATTEAIGEVLTEEFGHFLDSLVNEADSAGDEGAIFAAILRDGSTSKDVMDSLRGENDRILLTLSDGSLISAEALLLEGGEGDDEIFGTSADDTIIGRGGNDYVEGRGGNDTIRGGEGNDRLYGGPGNDEIWGDSGVDNLYGEDGNDIFRSLNADNAYGGDGNDQFYGGAPVGVLDGGDGDDYFEGAFFGSSPDWSYLGTPLTTRLSGGRGNDIFNLQEGVYVPISTTDILVDGGEGYDVLRYATGYSSWMGDTADRQDFILNTRNFERIELYEANVMWVGASALTDAVINDGLDFEIRIERGYSEIDASAERGSRITFRMINANASVQGGQLSDNFHGSGEGVDTFRGNGGNDYFNGGDGRDIAVYSGNAGDYTVSEITYNQFTVRDNRSGSPDGTDTIVDVNVLRFADGDQNVLIRGLRIVGDETANDLEGGQFADLLDGAGGNDHILGNGGNDDIRGGRGNDTLEGGDGDDIVDGGEGDDLIIGGNGRGNDRYIGGSGIDTVRYTSALAAITVNLATGIATSTAGGDAAGIGTDTLSGIENVIAGNFNDTLTGDSQNNRLDGWLGADTMRGGLGNDTYIVDNTGDRVEEAASAGTDTVQSSISYTLGANVENLILTGSGVINGTGNGLNNVITGNGSANVLNGGVGADTMRGGLGNDTYIVDNTGDRVEEAASAGTDTVQSSISYTLGANVENLILTGSGVINGTGNGLNNVITGNGSANLIDGGNGSDSLNGGSGNDRLIGGNGNDNLNGGAGADTLTGIALNDTTLGRGTIDVLTGGTENDLFVLGNASGVFYSDGSTATAGRGDYARITDFRSGDRIQLKGRASNYILRSNDSVTGFSGVGLYRNDGVGTGASTGWDSRDEFIALIQVGSGVGLNLGNTSQFTYVA